MSGVSDLIDENRSKTTKGEELRQVGMEVDAVTVAHAGKGRSEKSLIRGHFGGGV